MDFDFSDEQKELKQHVRRFLAERCGRAVVRGNLDGIERHDLDLWQEMGELGYLGPTIPEVYGGLGLGYLEACVVAEEMGRALAPLPFACSIAQAAECLMLAGSESQKSAWLPRLASGAVIGTLALAEAPGRYPLRDIQTTATLRADGYPISGQKVAVAFGDVAEVAVVAALDMALPQQAAAVRLFLVELGGPGVARGPAATIDPTRSHANLVFADAPAQRLGELAQASTILGKVDDRAAVLVAFEQLGGAECAMEMARDYALSRFAFGRPIGSMQAIKHLLAEMFVQVSLSRSNCYYSAWALSTQAPELPEAAAAARVCATQAYQFCSRQNIQVHGGMGFTWEVDCHLHFRRANLLALALGPLSTWEDRLIGRLRDKYRASSSLPG